MAILHHLAVQRRADRESALVIIVARGHRARVSVLLHLVVVGNRHVLGFTNGARRSNRLTHYVVP